jgi:hypothetical protein
MVPESLEDATWTFMSSIPRIYRALHRRVVEHLPAFEDARPSFDYREERPGAFSCTFTIPLDYPLVGTQAVTVYIDRAEAAAILGDDWETFDAYCRHFDLYNPNASAETLNKPEYRAAWSDREAFAEARRCTMPPDLDFASDWLTLTHAGL